MNLHNNTGWFLGVFMAVTLITGGSYVLNNKSTQSAMIQFSELSDADIDLILSVKAEMHAANNQSYY